MTTLAEFRTEILETAGLADDDARFPSATLNRMINRGLRSLSAEHVWPWQDASETINTVADTGSYVPNAAWVRTKRLTAKGRDLVEMHPESALPYLDGSGAPIGYFIEEDEIHFVPVPDGAYAVTHVYESEEPTLSADGDSPLLPERYTDWLVFTVLVQVATRLRDSELYQIADRERGKWFRRASDEVRRSTGGLVVRGRSDWTV